MKKLMLICLLMVLCGCGKEDKMESEGTYKNAKGETSMAKVTFSDNKITKVELDETTGDTTKKKLGDKYDMRDASPIGKNWDEQIAYLESYIKRNGIENIKLDASGKAVNEDILSGCTIAIDGYIKAIEDAKNKLK
ncbi:MAG: FMN-binding protein [Erysipelotrichaceae bacterium]|nr:FMN-binding protein [Erysipelotrichaceae bacterium]